MFQTVIFVLIVCQVQEGLGVLVPISKIPYQVSIQATFTEYTGESYTYHFCSGTLITKHMVLTSAICTYWTGASSLQVRLGSVKHDEGGRLVKVNRKRVHPKFKFEETDYDFSILILANYSTNNLTIGFAKLPLKNEFLTEGTIVTASGWNNHILDPKDPNLRAINVSIVNPGICYTRHFNGELEINTQTICFSIDERDNLCKIDSGGPLTLNNTIIGVASTGCDELTIGKPTVYGRVLAVRNWIRQVTGV